MKVLPVLIAVFLLPIALSAEEVRVLSWNVESGGNNPDTIAEELEEFDGFDILALSEVNKRNASKYVSAFARDENSNFEYRYSRTGCGDRLVIAWDSSKFDHLDTIFLDDLAEGCNRDPMAVKLKLRDSGTVFWLMNNHLNRGTESTRNNQAKGVREWIADQSLPVFAVGDYNFDFDIDEEEGNRAYEIMFRSGEAIWIRPSHLVRTEDSHNSVLDFAISNDKGLVWGPSSEILVSSDDFTDTSNKSDHRPVTLKFNTSANRPVPRSVLDAIASRDQREKELDLDDREFRNAVLSEIRALRSEVRILGALAMRSDSLPSPSPLDRFSPKDGITYAADLRLANADFLAANDEYLKGLLTISTDMDGTIANDDESTDDAELPDPQVTEEVDTLDAFENLNIRTRIKGTTNTLEDFSEPELDDLGNRVRDLTTVIKIAERHSNEELFLAARKQLASVNTLMKNALSERGYKEATELSDQDRVSEVVRPQFDQPVDIPNLDEKTQQPFNRDARLSHSVREFEGTFHDGKGEKITAAVVDGGKIWSTHVEFENRVSIADDWGGFNSHATHVAGTMAAKGVKESARGMAPGLKVKGFSFQNHPVTNVDELSRLEQSSANIQVSNHSYGPRSGWEKMRDSNGTEFWTWWGELNQEEDETFGKYTFDCARLDKIVFNAPHILPVVAAGNDRDDGPPTQPVEHYVPVIDPATNKLKPVKSTKIRKLDGFDNGLDTITGLGIAKNALCVGAINDLFRDGEPILGAQIRSTFFSGQGPSDDFRIKPDVVANGQTLLSTSTPPATSINPSSSNNTYNIASGTSMASPTAAGICCIVAEFFEEKLGRKPTSAELKGVIIHSALDAGEKGPDAQFGWGAINAFRAGEVINGDFVFGMHRVEKTKSLTLEAKATGMPIRVSVVWTDPAGNPNDGGLDNSKAALQNDLDLKLVSPSGKVFFPYRLDKDNPSGKALTDGPNKVDNVEVIDARHEAGIWKIIVTGSSFKVGDKQDFALIATGLKKE